MGKFNFYFNQGLSSLKRSALVIIGLTVAISMVAGLNFYLDAYQTQSLEESYNYLVDTYVYRQWDDEIVPDYEKTFHDEVNHTIEEFERHEYFHEEWYEFYQTYSNDFFPQTQEDLKYSIFPADFYQSNRFSEYFTIYQGSAPLESDEIMIDYSYALVNNISAGDTIRYNYTSDDEFFTDVLNITVFYEINFTISGIYIPNRPDVRVLQTYFNFQWYLDPITLDPISNRDLSKIYLEYYLVFSSFNFSQSIPHPIQTMWTNISSQIYALTTSYIEVARYYTGLMGIYDRESYSYRNILSTAIDLRNKKYNIRDSLMIDVGSPLSTNLRYYAEEMQLLRIVTQFMNLPIIGFGVFIGVFSFRISTKERSDEFLLLRSKGIPQRMVRNTFIMEATLLGISSSTLALVAGRGTYELYKTFMGKILDVDFFSPLQFRMSVISVIAVYGVGIGMAVISSLPSIRSINKLESSELLTELGSDSFDVTYDETTLFTVNPNQKITLADTPFMQSNSSSLITPQGPREASHFESESEHEPFSESSKKVHQKSSFWSRMIRPRDSNASLYRNTLKKKERKIRKTGWLLISVSLVPGLYYLLIRLSQQPSVSDIIYLLGDRLLSILPTFLVLAMLSPLLLIIGVSRLVMKENPSRFARIIKRVARPFVGQKDYIVALQMIKQKDFRRFINLLAIFTSLFTFANIFFVSFNATQIVDHNYTVGGDARIKYEYEFFTENIGNQMGDLTVSNFLAFEQNITQSTTNTSQKFITDSAFYVGYYNSKSRSQEYFINISKYIQIIQEDEKYMPNKAYGQQLEIIEQTEDNSTYPQVIVTEDYLQYYDLEIGDVVGVDYLFTYSGEEPSLTYTLTVQIMAALPFFLGLCEYMPSLNNLRPGMILDISLLDSIPFEWEDSSWDPTEFGQIFDIYDEYAHSISDMQSLFFSALPTIVKFNEIKFYQAYLKDLDNAPEELTMLYFIYRVLYTEFFIVGAITAITLAIFMLGMLRKNKYLNGLLLSRGLGFRGLNKFMLVQLMIILVLALGMGLFCGSVSAIILIRIMHQIDFGRSFYPLLAKPLDFLSMFSSIIGLTVCIYGVTFYLESKKNISEYFRKF